MFKPRPWQEPAHSAVIQRFDDMVVLYKYLRKDLQAQIDKVFDKVAKQIGFVVTTTLPINVGIGDDGKVVEVKLASTDLQGTLFATEFAPILEKIQGSSFGKSGISAGSYQLLLVWYDALRLKLKHDWMEPAHFQPAGRATFRDLTARVRPEVQEPAHWFDAGNILAIEEELLISVIDEVYPELKLADRVAMGRYETRKYLPGVREPAHFRFMLESMYAEQVSRKFVPGVREPAHFQNISDLLADPSKLQLLSELSALLRKLGI